jgi:ABC-type nitrate/sulfonate/bicarbonate transport system permease component
MGWSHNRWLQVSVEVVTTLAVLGLIWLLTARSHSPYVVSLPTIFKTFRQVWIFQRFTSDVLPSLERLALGFSAAVLVGVPLGLLLGMADKRVRMFTRPVTTFLRSVPPPLMVPVAIAIFAIGLTMKIFVIAFVCMWPITLNTEDGYTSLDPTILETTQSYGIRGWNRLFKVVLPAVSPRIFAGLRTSIAIAVLLLVVAEQLGSTNGIGWFVLYSQQGYDVKGMWAGIVMLGLLGIAASALLSLIERVVLRWHFRMRATNA